MCARARKIHAALLPSLQIQRATANLSFWRIWVHQLWRRNWAKTQRGKRACFGCYMHTHTHASTYTHVHIYARTHITPFSLAIFLSPSSCLLSSSRCTSINLQSFVREIPSKSSDHNSLLPNPPKQGYSR